MVSTLTARDQGDLYSAILAACNEQIRALAARENVALIDFARAVPWDPVTFYDLCHLRDIPEGLQRKGSVFGEALVRMGIIDRAAHRLGATPDAPSPSAP